MAPFRRLEVVVPRAKAAEVQRILALMCSTVDGESLARFDSGAQVRLENASRSKRSVCM